MSDRPVLYLIAGPNGSGKSTYTSAFPSRVPLLDPDAVARLINPRHPRAAAVEAGRRVATHSASLISQRQSFAVETTLAGNHPLRLMESAKKASYRINLVYIGLEHPGLNAERVAARVARGGHDVPLPDIERRIERSIHNLPKALLLAERAEILDNSNAFEPYRLVARKRGGTVTQLSEELPGWLDEALLRYEHVSGRSIRGKRRDL